MKKLHWIDSEFDEVIANCWCHHFSGLYNSVNDADSRDNLYTQLSDSIPDSSRQGCMITLQDIADACCHLKSCKALGPEGITAESLIFGQ